MSPEKHGDAIGPFKLRLWYRNALYPSKEKPLNWHPYTTFTILNQHSVYFHGWLWCASNDALHKSVAVIPPSQK